MKCFLPGIPASPEGVTIHTDTFTSSSVSISWTESSSDCVTGYRYNVSLEDHQILNTTSNSPVTVEGLVPSYDLYYVVINSFDTANRNSSDSDPECVYFNGEHVHTIIHLSYQVHDLVHSCSPSTS